MTTHSPLNSKPSVLVVDDDSITRNALQEYLEKHDYEVRVAASAAELDQFMEQGSPDLVILDGRMPDEDGLSLSLIHI